MFYIWISYFDDYLNSLFQRNKPARNNSQIEQFSQNYLNTNLEYYLSQAYFSERGNLDIPQNLKCRFQTKQFDTISYKPIECKKHSINIKKIIVFSQNYCLIFLNNNIFLIITTVTQPSILQYLKILKNLVKDSSTKTQEVLIKKLNPKILSWCYHYRYLANSKDLNYCDFKLLNDLWKWACRRHNNKSKKWIKCKYFFKFNDKNWIFGNYSYSDSIISLSKKRSSLLLYLPFHYQIVFNLKKLL